MTRTETLKAIEDQWRSHCAIPFPEGVAGDEVSGICLVSLDTYAAGCIQTYLECAGALDHNRLRVLESCTQDLAIVVPELTGDARDYFSRLEKLARLVLQSVRDRGIEGRIG